MEARRSSGSAQTSESSPSTPARAFVRKSGRGGMSSEHCTRKVGVPNSHESTVVESLEEEVRLEPIPKRANGDSRSFFSKTSSGGVSNQA